MSEALPSFDEECFFVAPIGAEDSPERKRSDGVLEFIVGRAASELGLRAVRADQLSEPGQITLQVLDHILRARVAVADLTGLNPNVFYELAVRHTARLPVALIAEKGSKLPFDIGQMRTIFFDSSDLRSADQCRKDIVAHLREALDRDLVDSPIATTLDLRAMSAGSAVERSVADIRAGIEDLARSQREMGGHMESLAKRMQHRPDVEPLSAWERLEQQTILDRMKEVARDRDDTEIQGLCEHLEAALGRRSTGPKDSRLLMSRTLKAFMEGRAAAESVTTDDEDEGPPRP